MVADDVAVQSNETAFIEVHQNGYYSVQVKAEGFIDADFEMHVQCTSEDCENAKLVSMSPELEPGQTRIMLTWEKENPVDLDIHIVAVQKSDQSTCRTFYECSRCGLRRVPAEIQLRSGHVGTGACREAACRQAACHGSACDRAVYHIRPDGKVERNFLLTVLGCCGFFF